MAEHQVLEMVPIEPVGLVEDILLVEGMPQEHLHIVPRDVREPALLLVQVLVDWLPVLVYGYWFASLGVTGLEVVLHLQSRLPADALLDLPVYQARPALY